MFISTRHTTHLSQEYYSLRDCVLWELLFFKPSNIGTWLNVFYIIIFSYFGTSSRINILHTIPSLGALYILWIIYILIWRRNDMTATLQRLDNLRGLKFFFPRFRTFSIKKNIYILYICGRISRVFLCTTRSLPIRLRRTIRIRLFNIWCWLSNIIFVRSGKIKTVRAHRYLKHRQVCLWRKSNNNMYLNI